MSQICYILCGIPGSGKSTFAKKNLPNAVLISRDICRVELGFTTSVDDKFVGVAEGFSVAAHLDDRNNVARFRIISGSKQEVRTSALGFAIGLAIANLLQHHRAVCTADYLIRPNAIVIARTTHRVFLTYLKFLDFFSHNALFY